MNNYEFGVVIATYPGDYHFAKATCESVRQFMPGVPICLIVDGNVNVKSLIRSYGIIAIYRKDVTNDFLRKHSFGFGFTKMVAFWESPFERFLYLDADAVLWGDVRTSLGAGAEDLVTSTPHEPNPPSQIGDQYFSLDRLQELIGPFEHEGRPYFNAGVFAARRGCFALEHYKRLFKLSREHEGLFISGDQGVLNLMALQAQEAGSLTWTQVPLQQIMGTGGAFDGWSSPPWHNPFDRFRIENGEAIVQPYDQVVLHWAAGKPSLLTHPPGTELMTHFRRQALRRMYPWLAPIADQVLEAEERTWVARRALRKGPRHMGSVVAREVRRVGQRLLATDTPTTP